MHSKKFLKVDKTHSDHVAINYLAAFIYGTFLAMSTLNGTKMQVQCVYLLLHIRYAVILAGMWPCGILV